MSRSHVLADRMRRYPQEIRDRVMAVPDLLESLSRGVPHPRRQTPRDAPCGTNLFVIMETANRARGALYGLAIGDALGMPTQMLSRAEIVHRWGPLLPGFEPAPPGHSAAPPCRSSRAAPSPTSSAPP